MEIYVKKEKPSEIILLVILEIAYGLGVWGVVLYFWPPIEWWQYAVMVWSILPFSFAYFIWARKRWVWNVALTTAVAVVIGSSVWYLLRSWTGMVDVFFNLPIIYLLARPQVKAFMRSRVDE